MAEEVSEQQLKEQEQAPSQLVENKPKKSYGWLIFSVINLIFILALAGGGYYLLQETKDKQIAQGDEINKDDMREIELTKQLNVFQSQLGTMQSHIAAFSQDIAGKDNHFTKTLADFSELHSERLETVRKELSAEITQLKRQLGKTRGDWLIADAEYLLSVANQRLHLMSDVKTTKMALEAADQRLRESGDSAVYKVRTQITKEIASLKRVKQADIVGIYSSIQLLKDKVDKLAVILPYAGKPLTESKQVHDHQRTENEHGGLDAVLSVLEDYVTVKHSDYAVTKILTIEEVGFIRQQLGVKLEMIKIALVQQNELLFKTNIADAQQWLNLNFTKNTLMKEFSTAFDKLNTIRLSSQLPDVSQSLKMLKDITKLRLELDKGQENPQQQLSLPSKKVSVAPKKPALELKTEAADTSAPVTP